MFWRKSQRKLRKKNPGKIPRELIGTSELSNETTGEIVDGTSGRSSNRSLIKISNGTRGQVPIGSSAGSEGTPAKMLDISPKRFP